MRWNDLYCEHLLNWICETKKGMISSLFNWSDKYKFKGKLYGFQPIERKKYIWYFSFECQSSECNTKGEDDLSCFNCTQVQEVKDIPLTLSLALSLPVTS